MIRNVFAILVVLSLIFLISREYAGVPVGAVNEFFATSSVTTIQNSHFSANGKYKQIAETTVDGYTYNVTEYVGPQGAGYILRTDDGTTIVETDFGPEGRNSTRLKGIIESKVASST